MPESNSLPMHRISTVYKVSYILFEEAMKNL